MSKVTSPKELETRLVQLRDPDWHQRYAAARALIEIGDEAADALVVLLEDDDHYIRGQVCKCLGAIKSPRAVDPLIERLNDPNGAVRQEAVRALGMMGQPAVQPLLERVKEGSPGMRRGAIHALSTLRDASVRPALEAIAKDMMEPASVRWEAKLAVNRLRETPRL